MTCKNCGKNISGRISFCTNCGIKIERAKDYYEILGVYKKSSKEEIKKAYHILAHQYHPDKNNGHDQRFKEVNEAYRILSDDKTRSQYDLSRKEHPDTKKENHTSSQDSKEPEKNKKNRYGLKDKEVSALLTISIIFVLLIILISFIETISGSTTPNTNNQIASTEKNTTESHKTTDTKTEETPVITPKTNTAVEDAPVVIPKTDNQICHASYGSHSYSTGVQNSQGGLTCDCSYGYMWDSTNTTCISKPEYNDISLGSKVTTQNNTDFSFTWSTIGQTITDYTWGWDYMDKTTAGNFAVVSLSINSNALIDSAVSVQKFSLKDQAGRVYYPSTGIFCGEATQDSLFSPHFIWLKPDIPCVSKLLFEVSKDSNSTNLIFQYK